MFTQYVQQNPTAPLAPNAYYWMGESYMNLKAYEKAIVQFQEVIDRFPQSEKAAQRHAPAGGGVRRHRR